MLIGLIVALAVALQGAPEAAHTHMQLAPWPRLVKSEPPKYPSDAVRAGLDGEVIVECNVGIDGRVTQARVIKGEPPLSDAAVAAVNKWRYRPLLVEGEPKEFVLTVTARFKSRPVTVNGLCESLRSSYEAVRESAASLLGLVQSGARVRPADVAMAKRELKALLDHEQSRRVRTAAEVALERLESP